MAVMPPGHQCRKCSQFLLTNHCGLTQSRMFVLSGNMTIFDVLLTDTTSASPGPWGPNHNASVTIQVQCIALRHTTILSHSRIGFFSYWVIS